MASGNRVGSLFDLKSEPHFGTQMLGPNFWNQTDLKSGKQQANPGTLGKKWPLFLCKVAVGLS